MGNEWDAPVEGPVLTLNPFEEKPAVPEAPAAPEPPKWDDSMLSEAEKKMVEDFAGQIDLSDSAAVLQYGAGAQKKMADFSGTEQCEDQGSGGSGNLAFRCGDGAQEF